MSNKDKITLKSESNWSTLTNIEEQNIFPFVSIERDISTMDI